MNFMNSIYLKISAQCPKLKYGQQEQRTEFNSV